MTVIDLDWNQFDAHVDGGRICFAGRRFTAEEFVFADLRLVWHTHSETMQLALIGLPTAHLGGLQTLHGS